MRSDHHSFLSATQLETEKSHFADIPYNMKYVQTASSTTDIVPTKSKLHKRCYSEEEIYEDSRRYNREELQAEILEWIDVYNDKLKVKLLREKMKKLVQKLTKPGGKFALICDCNPRELEYLIDNITTQIMKLQVNPEHTFSDRFLREELIRNLKAFPLKPGYNSDYNIAQLANDLIDMLKDKQHRCHQNFAVYGVSLKNNTTTATDFSIQSIKDDDIKSNLDNYAKQLVGHINEWFNNLNVPHIKEQSFKEVVINDLAGDIIDRHKYLELNPRAVGTNEEELEHLKYKIFKWINKLVGEGNLVTIEHAADLMNRIQNIPVPMLVKPQEKILLSLTESIQSRSLKLPQNTVTNAEKNKLENVIQTSEMTHGSYDGQLEKSRRLSSEGDLGVGTTPKSASKSSQNTILRQSASNPGKPVNPSINKTLQNQANTLPEIYDKYQKVFIEKSSEIVNAAIPTDKSLAGMAKTGIYKGILNAFFILKSNPDVENDYACFEFMLEDKVDDLIDLLPHTTELDNIKHNWKISVLINAVDMLKEMHSVTDKPTFRQQLTNRLNRKALKDLEDKECVGLQQGFLVEKANDYILETKYKQDDPIKSNIYKQRLMKKLDDFANHITKEHKLGFKYINRVAFKRLAMKVLDEVPIPINDILQEEVEEILLAEEIQQWYRELPTCPYLNDMDVLLRQRLIDILARKLNEIDKKLPRDDPSKERLMKHEMTVFLERKGKLKRDEDLNINFMVDELNNRLKNRWVDRPIEYESFDRDNPASSTLAWFENDDILQPVEVARDSDTVYTQSYDMSNDNRSYGGDNFQNCQPPITYLPYRTEKYQNQVDIIQNGQGGYYSNLGEVGMDVYEVNPGYKSYNEPHGSDDRTCMETSLAKDYEAKMRADMPAEEDDDGRLRRRCRCNMRRSYVCCNCEDGYRRIVPCRYYY